MKVLRKPESTEMEITVHAKRVEPSHIPCYFLENFSGFHSTREHNASNLPKCLDDVALQPYHHCKSSKSFNTLQQIANKKKRHPRGCPCINKRRVDSHSHPQHDVGIDMQFTANLTPHFESRLTLT